MLIYDHGDVGMTSTNGKWINGVKRALVQRRSPGRLQQRQILPSSTSTSQEGSAATT